MPTCFPRVQSKHPGQSCYPVLACHVACDPRTRVSLRTAVGSGRNPTVRELDWIQMIQRCDDFLLSYCSGRERSLNNAMPKSTLTAAMRQYLISSVFFVMWIFLLHSSVFCIFNRTEKLQLTECMKWGRYFEKNCPCCCFCTTFKMNPELPATSIC